MLHADGVPRAQSAGDADVSSVDRSPAGPAPAQDAIVNVFVEIPVGGGVRYRSARGISEPFEGVDVVPALADVAYGFVVDTYNAADGDAATLMSSVHAASRPALRPARAS